MLQTLENANSLFGGLLQYIENCCQFADPANLDRLSAEMIQLHQNLCYPFNATTDYRVLLYNDEIHTYDEVSLGKIYSHETHTYTGNSFANEIHTMH